MRRLGLLAALCAGSLALAAPLAAAPPTFAVVPDGSAVFAVVPEAPPIQGAAEQIGDAGLSATLDAFLAAQGSPMAGLGWTFVAAGQTAGVDPRYLVALSGAESSFGIHLFRPFNPFGWGYITFPSFEDAIRTVAGGLQRGYLAEGRTDVFSISAKYAPVGASNDPNGTNGEHPYNVAKFLQQLGGNPNDVRSGRAANPGVTAPVTSDGSPAKTVWGNALGAQAASIALQYVGVPYVWGGATPAGFDCSGLAMFAYAQVGVTLSHWTGHQWNEGVNIPAPALQPGDLLFFDLRGGAPQHEGIYLGAGLMVQAPKRGDIVRVVPLLGSSYSGRFVRAVRPYGA